MKINMLRSAGLLVGVALSLIANPVSAGTAYSKLVVFGDSLTDSGNMVEFTGGLFPNAPEYVYGRQSNGPVWVEYLASRLRMSDRIVNYAVVGAMTAAAPGYPTGNVWSDTFSGLEGTDVISQVQDYLTDAGGVADPSALYVLQGGANDFPRVADPSVIVENLATAFVMLQSSGAKHIVVVNLPDLGRTPRVILAEQMGLLPPGTGAYLSMVIAQLNDALAGTIAMLAAPGVTVTLADMYGFVNAAAVAPDAFGFTNVTMPYLLAGTGDPAEWLFWDDLHPTTRGHEVFAESVVTSLIRSYSPRNGKGDGRGLINSLTGLVKQPKP